jgi:hypothetical protein
MPEVSDEKRKAAVWAEYQRLEGLRGATGSNGLAVAIPGVVCGTLAIVFGLLGRSRA